MLTRVFEGTKVVRPEHVRQASTLFSHASVPSVPPELQGLPFFAARPADRLPALPLRLRLPPPLYFHLHLATGEQASGMIALAGSLPSPPEPEVKGAKPIPLWFCMRWRPDVPGLIGLLSSIRPGHSNADFSEILPVLYFYGDPRLSNYTLILHMVQFLLTNSYGSRVFVYQFMS